MPGVCDCVSAAMRVRHDSAATLQGLGDLPRENRQSRRQTRVDGKSRLPVAQEKTQFRHDTPRFVTHAFETPGVELASPGACICAHALSFVSRPREWNRPPRGMSRIRSALVSLSCRDQLSRAGPEAVAEQTRSVLLRAMPAKKRGVGDDDEDFLPRELAETLDRIRPRCPFFQTPHGCKKGVKCPFSHDGVHGCIRVPYLSRHKEFATVRPPLTNAWEVLSKKFGIRNIRVTMEVMPGTTDIEGGPLVLARITGARPWQEDVCARASLEGLVDAGGGRKRHMSD